MSTKRTQVVFDAWGTYLVNTEEGPWFISFDDEAAREDLTSTLRHCARVIIPIREPNAAGGPDNPEAERLWAMEDALCDALGAGGVVCRLVGRLTHAGQRELVYQLDDPEVFRPVAQAWIDAQHDYPIAMVEHEGWAFFDDCVRPTAEDWLWMADEQVVSNLLEAGSDPEKEHALEFFFEGAPAALKEVEAALLERGYERPAKSDSGPDQLMMVKRMRLELAEIFDESLANQRLAQEHGVECDGWGAEVVR
jgi:regulator of RNase E activity RraB